MKDQSAFRHNSILMKFRRRGHSGVTIFRNLGIERSAVNGSKAAGRKQTGGGCVHGSGSIDILALRTRSHSE